MFEVIEAPTYSQPSVLPSSRLDSLETSPHGTDAFIPLGPDEPLPDPGIEFRHSGWEPRRRCVIEALEGIPGTENRQHRFRQCGSNAWVMESDDEPGTYRIACDKCKDRFCDPCARERARHIGQCVGKFATGREIRFITLTLRHTSRTLKQDVDRLYASFTKLRRRAKWKATQQGGIFFIEVKRRRGDRSWHVHMHILAEGLNLAKRWLSDAWLKATGDSFIVDLSLCDDHNKAAYYAAKYAGKGLHGTCYHEPEILREGMQALKGRRLVGKWGTWSDLDLDTEPPEGEWHGVDTLNRLIERSSRGDTEAAMILQSLTGEKPCQTNPNEQPAHGP